MGHVVWCDNGFKAAREQHGSSWQTRGKNCVFRPSIGLLRVFWDFFGIFLACVVARTEEFVMVAWLFDPLFDFSMHCFDTFAPRKLTKSANSDNKRACNYWVGSL